MMKDTLFSLLTPFGPSGQEGPIAAAIAEMIRPHADELRTDAMGNLIAVRHGPGKRIMFCAHMDQIGYIVLDADKEGFLRVSNVGGVNPASAGFRHVVFQNGVTGVIACEPLADDKPGIEKLYIDVGADSREKALEIAPIGTMAVIAHQASQMGDHVAAPYMDDRAACAVLVELLKALGKPKHEIIAVFTVQEEVGVRGATTAAYSVQPDFGLAIDVTPAGGVPKCDPPLPAKVGKGPAVKVKDSGSISTPVVRDGLVAAAKRAGIAFQYEVLPYGGTDARAIMVSRGGVPSGTLSIPCRYVHSPVETVSVRDMEECVRLLKVWAEEIVE
ncbi:MAG: M20/M25/M40 family metallo-hydrolase [Firmicutes bacterium]|nr:M20/M25/M40 family metallo-hydrolase [Bacillota bacterium]